MRHAHAIAVSKQRTAHVALQLAHASARRQRELFSRIDVAKTSVVRNSECAQLRIAPKRAHALVTKLEGHVVTRGLLAASTGAVSPQVRREPAQYAREALKPRKQSKAR